MKNKTHKCDEKFKASELFGITIKRAEELIKEFKHHKIDSSDMVDLATRLDLNNSGELGFKCLLFGKLVAENDAASNSPLASLLRKAMEE